MSGGVRSAGTSPSADPPDGMILSSPEAGRVTSQAAAAGVGQTPGVSLWSPEPELERRPPPEPTPELLALVDEAEQRGAEEARERQERDGGREELLCEGGAH